MRLGALLPCFGIQLFSGLLVTAGLAAADVRTLQGDGYANHLIDSNDPYLLLHAHNPVDWYPWGPEALAKASSARHSRPRARERCSAPLH